MKNKFAFIVTLVILFAGCNSNELEFDNITVQPITGTYSFPLGEVSYTMRELIDNIGDGELDLQEDSTSLLTLFYADTFSYSSDTDFLQIDDVTNSASVDLTGLPPLSGPGSFDIADSFTLDYNAADDTDRIDSVFYETGDATIDVTTTINGTIDYTATISNFVTVVNETPLEISGTVNGPGNDISTRSLLNHKSLLTNKTFVTNFNATVTLDAGQSFSGTETLTFDLTFANQTFSVVYGNFGQDTVQVGSETLEIEFFREMGEEGIFFGNPTITFNFDNTFGIPLGIDFSTLFGDDGEGGTQTFLEGDIVDEIPVIETSDPADPGSVVSSTIQINNSNSTIDNLLATSPAQLGFNVQAISNPYDADGSNFITDNNQLDATIEIEIPMEIKLENLEQSGTLSLGGGLDVSNVDSAFMRIVTVNELPFSAVLALEIQDADSNSLYSVTNNLVLNAPFININGFVTDPNGVSADIPLTQAGIEALGTGSHVLLTVTLNTPGSLNSRDIFVKVLADYAIEIKVGVGAKVNIPVE